MAQIPSIRWRIRHVRGCNRQGEVVRGWLWKGVGVVDNGLDLTPDGPDAGHPKQDGATSNGDDDADDDRQEDGDTDDADADDDIICDECPITLAGEKITA